MLFKKIIFSFFTITLLMLVSGCGSDGTKPLAEGEVVTSIDTNLPKLEGVTAAEGETEFGYKLEKGSKFTYKIAFINNIDQSMKADTSISQKVEQKNVIVINFEVKDVDKDTIAEVEVTTTSIYIFSDVNGEKKEYKTGDKLDSAKKLDFGFYEALINNPFMARIDKKGVIKEVYKVDKIVTKALPENMGKDSLNPQQLEAATKDISENLKGMIMQVFRAFSPGTLKANETFRDKKAPVNDPNGMYQLNATQLYTLKEKGKFEGKDISVIEAGYEASYQYNPDLEKQGYKIDKSEITGGGKVFYNNSDRLLMKSNTRLTEEIQFSGKVPSQAGAMVDFLSKKKSVIINIVERLK